MDKSKKDKSCNKENPLLNNILEEIPFNLRAIIRKINDNKQIKLQLPKGNQVIQITIDKISLPILASGIAHN